jgi:hypothetical protein
MNIYLIIWARYTLLQVFSKFGKVTKLDYLFHKTGLLKGKPRGYAFIEYGNKDVSFCFFSSPFLCLFFGILRTTPRSRSVFFFHCMLASSPTLARFCDDPSSNKILTIRESFMLIQDFTLVLRMPSRR